MQPADPTSSAPSQPSEESPASAPDIVETRLWPEEHAWLYELLQSPKNTSPTFRFPDLISACVTLTLSTPEGAQAIFNFLGSQLVLRDPATARRREAMWRPQYEELQALQRTPANRHPNPKYQHDQFTTACVALCREKDPSGKTVLIQARYNTVDRSLSHLDIPTS
ncbi:MAG: hypothetical protein FWD67_04140 [Betaproteobacteria bacterium]|nr:hypothetical protein [Betaproteobacteria bacterium]